MDPDPDPDPQLCNRQQRAGRLLCAVGTGGLDLLRSFNFSQNISKFLCFQLPIA